MTEISPSKMKENQESVVETNQGQNVEQDEEILQHETTTVQQQQQQEEEEQEKGDESDEKEQSSKKRSLDENHENVIQKERTEDDQDPKSKKTKVENTHDDDDDDDEKDDTNQSEEVDVPPKSVFGFGSSYTSGFSAFKPTGSTLGFGFGSVSGTGAGSVSGTGSTTTGFGGGAAPGTLVFGQIGTTNTNGFGSSKTAFKPFTKGFGSSEDNEDADAVTMTNTTSGPTTNTTTTTTSVFAKPEISTGEIEEPTTFTPVVQLPQTSEEITNGEENEESILSLRAKLFKLTKVVVVVVAPNVTVQVSSPIQAKVGGIQMATKVGTQIDDSEKTLNQESTVDSADAKMDWKEVGIGPLRILTDDKHVRIVQRRENTPGGQGTKLILNIRLHEECRVERQADKFVKLAAFEAVDASPEAKESAKKFEMVQYLFKVKTVTEGDDLFETLKKYCKTK